jgi:hypothetical protein
MTKQEVNQVQMIMVLDCQAVRGESDLHISKCFARYGLHESISSMTDTCVDIPAVVEETLESLRVISIQSRPYRS